MDNTKLPDVILWIGWILICIAILWWFSNVNRLASVFQAPISDVFGSCFGHLFWNVQNECGAIIGIAISMGHTVYNPVILWIGAGLVIVGNIVRKNTKE